MGTLSKRSTLRTPCEHMLRIPLYPAALLKPIVNSFLFSLSPRRSLIALPKIKKTEKKAKFSALSASNSKTYGQELRFIKSDSSLRRMVSALAKADLPPCLHAFGRLLQHYREVMYEELSPDLIAKILEEVRGSLRQVHHD